ncbi:uncharacterized protein C8A04DRAFT_38709 [Dichotomopilus funicola]|uniref:Uncharacterized protein n=1 Tax=Dichotomopilus funicola TaxID=1934379 RepID=A0AAN6UZC3_9PEZI|nr:hypothetical protein C8A04DRAFT_38709 [Dichotomopilus funicola]
MSTTPKPLFVYGTLCALPLLAWALTGEATQVDAIKGMLCKATVSGYKRYALYGSTQADDFEGEVYKVTPVTASIEPSEDDSEGGQDTIEVDIYVWDGDMAQIFPEPWELDRFIADRLDDWLDLFDGMELVGSPED